jgi:hypothetical protein
MSIEQQPGKKPFVTPPPPTWGELAPEGRIATVVRFVLADRVVSFPVGELRRWEHVAGEPETLTINAGKELVLVEGRELQVVRAALDLGCLDELRVNNERSNVRPGPRVRRITIEPA